MLLIPSIHNVVKFFVVTMINFYLGKIHSYVLEEGGRDEREREREREGERDSGR